MVDFVSVIIVNWNAKHFLHKCIDSILNQSYPKLEIIFIDNDSNDGSFQFVQETYKDTPNLVKVRNINNGYAGGANKGIRMAKGTYVAILNPDIILEQDYIKNCLEIFKFDVKVAAVTGKLLKYDFEKDEKIDIIDSAGIIMTSSRKFYDRGQNIIDNGQFNKAEQVFAVCGAAPIFKRSILEQCKIQEEYFDEDFFSYKEDIDLCWRLNLYGYKCMYIPYAVAYHGRTMNGASGVFKLIQNRKQQSILLRQISFRNQYWMLMKNETRESFYKDKFKIILRLLVFLVYALFFEHFNFKMIKEICNGHEKMLKKRKIIMAEREKRIRSSKGIFTRE